VAGFCCADPQNGHHGWLVQERLASGATAPVPAAALAAPIVGLSQINASNG
jgi:hypothetical protein